MGDRTPGELLDHLLAQADGEPSDLDFTKVRKLADFALATGEEKDGSPAILFAPYNSEPLMMTPDQAIAIAKGLTLAALTVASESLPPCDDPDCEACHPKPAPGGPPIEMEL